MSTPNIDTFTQHIVNTDVGVIQKSALEEDLEGTVAALEAFYPLSEARVDELAAAIRHCACERVLCDIAPLGIVAAQRAGVRSVLIENFLWDLIYSGYVTLEPRLKTYMETLAPLFASADTRIQTEPVCVPVDADLTVPPVSRAPRQPPAVIRDQLGLPPDRPVILVTMGGLNEDTPFLQHLRDHRGFSFVLPGAVGQTQRLDGNVLMIPRHSGLYHPDLVNAADAVVGKLGYSTLAEVYHAGLPFGYILRDNFREGKALAAFVETRMRGCAISADGFKDGAWLANIEHLASQGRSAEPRPNGADAIAAYLIAT